jgi:hypothetical protein
LLRQKKTNPGLGSMTGSIKSKINSDEKSSLNAGNVVLIHLGENPPRQNINRLVLSNTKILVNSKKLIP